MRIFGETGSGNCLKVKMVADHLGLPYVWVRVDATRGESRTPEYLARFPMGQVPGVQFEDGRTLAQSNAIMRYLARGSDLVPTDPFAEAKVDEWLFWEQYSHEPAIAVCRFEMVFRGRSAAERDPARVAKGEDALDLMERHLDREDWFVGGAISIADIALYAYTQFAHEGGFSLDTRPAVRAWLARCASVLTDTNDSAAHQVA